MRTPGDTLSIKNKFGGLVVLAPATLGGGAADNAFSISYANVPGEVCTKLVTSAGAQFDQVTVGGTPVKIFGSNVVNPVLTATNCNADAGTGVPIVFTSL